MLQEGWEPDHITVNQMYNKAIQHLDNRKFGYSQPMTSVLKKTIA